MMVRWRLKAVRDNDSNHTCTVRVARARGTRAATRRRAEKDSKKKDQAAKSKARAAEKKDKAAKKSKNKALK